MMLGVNIIKPSKWKHWLVGLALGCLLISFADASEAKGEGDIVLEARLVEIPGTLPPNDLYNYVYIFKFKVLKVEKGELAQKEILVGQYNPLIPRDKIKDKMDSMVNGNAKKFSAGAKYKLTLKSPLEEIWSGAVEDEYFDSEDPRYFATHTDIIP